VKPVTDGVVKTGSDTEELEDKVKDTGQELSYSKNVCSTVLPIVTRL
jgi:hypothetical protein